MLGAQLCVRTTPRIGALADQTIADRQIACSLGHSSPYLSAHLRLGHKQCRRSKSIFICCKTSRSFRNQSNDGGDSDGEYLEAIVLVSETMRHHHMRLRRFQNETKWQSSSYLPSFSIQRKEFRADAISLGPDFLHHFQGPTIFLKISCDGDFLLPIRVGDFAVEKLIDSSREDESESCPNHYQLVRHLVEKLGFRISMVRITKRVVSTYFARIFFYKHGENGVLSIDARPSDAINVARRCNAPIYVNKQVVSTDAVRITYGMHRMREAKSVYDVSLDSAAEGPDLLGEELDLVMNLNLAVEEERYSDAAMWRDKLMKLRESKEH